MITEELGKIKSLYNLNITKLKEADSLINQPINQNESHTHTHLESR